MQNPDSIAYCKTDEQRTNGFTKIVSPQEWPATLEQIGILPNLAAAAAASAVAAQPADRVSSQSDVEAIAGSLPHRLSEEHILRLLGHLPNDGTIRGPSHSEVHCFILLALTATVEGLLAFEATLTGLVRFLVF